MSGSAFQLLMAQGWLSVWTTLITIISVFFFTYIEKGRTQGIDWSVASFMVGASFQPLIHELAAEQDVHGRFTAESSSQLISCEVSTGLPTSAQYSLVGLSEEGTGFERPG